MPAIAIPESAGPSPFASREAGPPAKRWSPAWPAAFRDRLPAAGLRVAEALRPPSTAPSAQERRHEAPTPVSHGRCSGVTAQTLESVRCEVLKGVALRTGFDQ